MYHTLSYYYDLPIRKLYHHSSILCHSCHVSKPHLDTTNFINYNTLNLVFVDIDLLRSEQVVSLDREREREEKKRTKGEWVRATNPLTSASVCGIGATWSPYDLSPTPHVVSAPSPLIRLFTPCGLSPLAVIPPTHVTRTFPPIHTLFLSSHFIILQKYSNLRTLLIHLIKLFLFQPNN